MTPVGETGKTVTSRETLAKLVDTGKIELRWSPLLDRDPPPPADDLADRVEGMLLGLAVGDALGNTSEGMLPADRRQAHGEIRDYLRNRHAGWKRMGLPSDDTQLAFWTLEQLLADGRLVPEHLADRFAAERIFGIGGSVRQFLANRRRHPRAPWHRWAARSAGNGALMRVAPVLVPHLRSPSADLWADAALAAAVTHDDAGSTAACVAFVGILWELLAMTGPPEPGWWIERYVAVARELETDKRYAPRGGTRRDYRGPMWRFTDEVLRDALHRDLSVLEGGRIWFSGAFLLETLPSALYVLARHGDDFEEAVVRAVNDTKDNDTVAAIVGAAAGALHGRAAIPERWLAGLTGRIGGQDDGRVFELLEASRTRWLRA